MPNDHAPSPIVPIQRQSKKTFESPIIPNYKTINRKPENWLLHMFNFFRFCDSQSENKLRPGQNQLIFIKQYVPILMPAPVNIVSEVESTWMTTAVDPNAVTSLHSIEIGGEGDWSENSQEDWFVTDCRFMLLIPLVRSTSN